MEKKINERLLEVRKYYKLTQKEMAELLGVQRTYYSELENGSRPISQKIIRTLSETKGISPDWLEKDIGVMHIGIPIPSFDKLVNKVRRFADDLRNTNEPLFNTYCDLDVIKFLVYSLNAFLQTIELYGTEELIRFRKQNLPETRPLISGYDEFYETMINRLDGFLQFSNDIEKFKDQLQEFMSII